MTYQRCTYCGALTHTVANCPKTWGGQAGRNAMRCGYCGGRDHKQSSCPKLGREGREPDDYVRDR